MSCCNHQKSNPGYIFGSGIITIVIGALAFIVALSWNNFIQEYFRHHCTKAEELDARLSYAFLVTGLAIIVSFIVLYYIDGTKL